LADYPLADYPSAHYGDLNNSTDAVEKTLGQKKFPSAQRSRLKESATQKLQGNCQGASTTLFFWNRTCGQDKSNKKRLKGKKIVLAKKSPTADRRRACRETSGCIYQLL